SQVKFATVAPVTKPTELSAGSFRRSKSHLAGEGERDPSHYVPELSRRARGFATWEMLKHLGRDGIAALIEQCCASARLVADLLSQ
ncbi:hypothetical protein ACC754_41000, partial [Rhizobium johnstonii]